MNITPKEILKRGTGNFINCTDYDDAIAAMEAYATQQVKSKDEEIAKLKAEIEQLKFEIKFNKFEP